MTTQLRCAVCSRLIVGPYRRNRQTLEVACSETCAGALAPLQRHQDVWEIRAA